MDKPVISPSRSKVRKAGSTLRDYAAGNASEEEREEALRVIKLYRALHSRPMLLINNQLRYHAQATHVDAKVSQRLKRENTIIDKITNRESKIDLSRMVDIGGLRVVVPSMDDLVKYHKAVAVALNEQITATKDYVANPRPSGYRAIHLHLKRDGVQIEVQLRTQLMHAWAELDESMSSITSTNLKQDSSATRLHSIAKELAEVYSQLDQGVLRPEEADQKRESAFQEMAEEILNMSEGTHNE